MKFNNEEADRKFGEAIFGEIEKRKDEIEPLQEEYIKLWGIRRGFSIYQDGTVDGMIKNMKKEIEKRKKMQNKK